MLLYSGLANIECRIFSLPQQINIKKSRDKLILTSTSEILIMLLLNKILLQMWMENMKFHADYIFNVHIIGKMSWITKDDNIGVGSITWYLFFSQTVISLCKANIEFWLLLPYILDSMIRWWIHIM